MDGLHHTASTQAHRTSTFRRPSRTPSLPCLITVPLHHSTPSSSSPSSLCPWPVGHCRYAIVGSGSPSNPAAISTPAMSPEKGRLSSVQFSSVIQSCPTLCDPMNCSTPGLPVHHQLPEFTQTHVHRVRDAIQPSHPRSSPSPPAPNLSQHQSFFQ